MRGKVGHNAFGNLRKYRAFCRPIRDLMTFLGATHG